MSLSRRTFAISGMTTDKQGRLYTMLHGGAKQGSPPQIQYQIGKKAPLEPAGKPTMMASGQTKPSPTRCSYCAQGAIPFQYVEEEGSKGMTDLAGLGVYLDLWQVDGLPSSIRRHQGVKGGRVDG